jgi:hypothetical protein
MEDKCRSTTRYYFRSEIPPHERDGDDQEEKGLDRTAGPRDYPRD